MPEIRFQVFEIRDQMYAIFDSSLADTDPRFFRSLHTDLQAAKDTAEYMNQTADQQNIELPEVT